MKTAVTKKSKDSPVNKGVFGLHHVTAITSDPQKNIEFYTNILGLRFVKLTVNQDDPTSYHLYYGDEVGHPGTILTFFNWPSISKGQRGRSEVAAISFLIPEDSIRFWIDRFKQKKIEFRGPYKRFENEQVITFNDPEGLELELINLLKIEMLTYGKRVPSLLNMP
jgi:glyoxalase family protein